VTAINSSLAADPELVNSDPYGDGWMLKLRIANPDQLDDLLDGDAYDELVAAG
jgi:glycine cleavage system H protein